MLYKTDRLKLIQAEIWEAAPAKKRLLLTSHLSFLYTRINALKVR
jgi:hypothetical protein